MADLTRAFLLAALLAAFACSDAPPDPSGTETSPAVSCGPYGHILPDALPGESYRSTDPRVRSVVVSNASVTFGAPWTVTVDELRGPGAVVVQLRDADHQTVCAALEGPL